MKPSTHVNLILKSVELVCSYSTVLFGILLVTLSVRKVIVLSSTVSAIIENGGWFVVPVSRKLNESFHVFLSVVKPLS